MGVVVRRYIDFLILLIPIPLVSVLFAAASLLFVHFVKCFFFIYSLSTLNWLQSGLAQVGFSMH